jgi:hypothetical protein
MLNLKKEFFIVSKYKSGRGQSGVSVFLTIIIMTIFLAIVLGLSAIFLGQLVMFREMGYSITAFYAADTGIEAILMNWENPTSDCTQTSPCKLSNQAEYYLDVTSSSTNPACLKKYCIKSFGIYKGVTRAIQYAY